MKRYLMIAKGKVKKRFEKFVDSVSEFRTVSRKVSFPISSFYSSSFFKLSF